MRGKLNIYPELIFPPMLSLVSILLIITTFTGLDPASNTTIGITNIFTATSSAALAIWIWRDPTALLPRYLLMGVLFTVCYIGTRWSAMPGAEMITLTLPTIVGMVMIKRIRQVLFLHGIYMTFMFLSFHYRTTLFGIIAFQILLYIAVWMIQHHAVYQSKLIQEEETKRRLAEAQLEQEQRVKNFIMFLKHELRNLATSLSGLVLILKREVRGEATGVAQADVLDAIAENTEQMETLTQQFILLVSKRQLPHVDKSVDVEPLVSQCMTEAHALVLRHQLNITIKSEITPCRLRANPTALALALRTAMRNALDALQERAFGAAVASTITIRGYHQDAHYIFAISDDGPGFPEDYLLRVQAAQSEQTPFSLIGMTNKPAGAGIGLPVMLQVAAQHCGFLHVQNCTPSGALVQIGIPLA